MISWVPRFQMKSLRSFCSNESFYPSHLWWTRAFGSLALYALAHKLALARVGLYFPGKRALAGLDLDEGEGNLNGVVPSWPWLPRYRGLSN